MYLLIALTSLAMSSAPFIHHVSPGSNTEESAATAPSAQLFLLAERSAGLPSLRKRGIKSFSYSIPLSYAAYLRC